MLERTMKPFGATAVFLAVINLLTADIINEADNTSSQAPDQSSPKTATSPSVIAGNAMSTSTSRSPIISTVSPPTEENPRVSTLTDLNKDVNDSNVASNKASSAPPKKEDHSFVTEATTPSIHGKQEVPSKEASTMPSGEPQNPAINDEESNSTTTNLPQVPSKEPSTRPSVEPQINPTINGKDSKDHDSNNSSGDTEKMSATSNKDPKDHDSSNSSNDAEKMSATNNKGIKIGAGCVAAVIAVIVLVVIYKICQKKPPASENPQTKPPTETKENVKLISVKTETPNPDMKMTSSNQMESIEC